MLRAIYHQLNAAASNRVVVDTERWIERRRREVGVYASQKGPWRQVQRPAKLVTSEQTFSPILGEGGSSQLVSEVGKKIWAEKSIASWVQQEYAITMLRNASVYGQNGTVISNRGSVLNEFYHGWSSDVSSSLDGAGYGDTLTLNWREFEGSAAVLSVSGWDSYYHFILQSIVRLRILDEHKKNVQKYILPKGIKRWHLDVLKEFGLEEENIIYIGSGEKVMVRRLYATTVPMAEGSVSKYSVEFLNEKQKYVNNKRRRKVYVVRGGRRRKVENEERITDELRKSGWVICDGEKMSFEEQVKVMKSASLIVGAHGAGLTNMVFTSEAKVLEIFPSDHIVPNCYDHLAERCGHDYYYLVSGELGTGDSFHISEDRLKKGIEYLREGPSFAE
ncbi:glycosyltransferase family 61 protein [Salinibacter sp.]|uniref:glycosyltransferase family 61 protein n=1 Tax=Salinibacter sp. TaxID=2065818 RepID=UPI0021E88BF1|nr:glycosyltransferase family 61 protein [Salinibacter sp.]